MLFDYDFQVCTYLTSKSWETRIAAGQAVEAIAKNVKRWQPGNSSSRQTSPSSVGGPAAGGGEAGRSKESSPDSDKDSDLLTFDTFDLEKVTFTICTAVITMESVYRLYTCQ